jgi:hypothetical protein
MVYAIYFTIFIKDIILILITLSPLIIYFFSQKYLTFTINNDDEVKNQVIKYIKTIIEIKDIKHKYNYSTSINIFISYCIKEGYIIEMHVFCPKIHCVLTDEIKFLLKTLEIKYDYYNKTIVINNLDEGIKYE